MTRELVLSTGMQFGLLKIVSKIPDDHKTRSPNLRKRWRVECQCKFKTRMTIPEYYLVRKGNPKVDCGCSRKTIKTEFNEEYRCWYMMHERTENPRHEAFKHYQKRNIKIDPLFHKSRGVEGFEAWLKEIGPRPSRAYSVDRRNNTLGYIPGNLRWATAEQQRQNQGDTIEGVPIKRT